MVQVKQLAMCLTVCTNLVHAQTTVVVSLQNAWGKKCLSSDSSFTASCLPDAWSLDASGSQLHSSSGQQLWHVVEDRLCQTKDRQECLLRNGKRGNFKSAVKVAITPASAAPSAQLETQLREQIRSLQANEHALRAEVVALKAELQADRATAQAKAPVKALGDKDQVVEKGGAAKGGNTSTKAKAVKAKAVLEWGWQVGADGCVTWNPASTEGSYEAHGHEAHGHEAHGHEAHGHGDDGHGGHHTAKQDPFMLTLLTTLLVMLLVPVVQSFLYPQPGHGHDSHGSHGSHGHDSHGHGSHGHGSELTPEQVAKIQALVVKQWKAQLTSLETHGMQHQVTHRLHEKVTFGLMTHLLEVAASSAELIIDNLPSAMGAVATAGIPVLKWLVPLVGAGCCGHLAHHDWVQYKEESGARSSAMNRTILFLWVFLLDAADSLGHVVVGLMMLLQWDDHHHPHHHLLHSLELWLFYTAVVSLASAILAEYLVAARKTQLHNQKVKNQAGARIVRIVRRWRNTMANRHKKKTSPQEETTPSKVG